MVMSFRRLLVILVLSSFVTTPIFAAKMTELIPAPEIELDSVEPVDIQRLKGSNLLLAFVHYFLYPRHLVSELLIF
jgi:hypothetical protein